MDRRQSRVRKLDDKQRAQVLGWIAEGLTTAEINDLAASYTDPDSIEAKPFNVSSQLVYQYRKDHDLDLQTLRAEREAEAITTGLALKANRIKQLEKLAHELEEDLYVKKLKWTQNAKGLGSGEDFEKYTFEEFNEAEIRQLRGVYDDLAKETGGRVQQVDMKLKGHVKAYMSVSPDDWDEELDKSKKKEQKNGKRKSKE